MELTLGLVAAYLLGSIPFALLTVRVLAGVDIRKIGSGNVGASNAARAFGKKTKYLVFLLVYFLDFGKGFVASRFFTDWAGFGDEAFFRVLLGAAAILGHCTSPFLAFKGGKGVATATGVAFVLAWVPLLIGIAVYFVVMALFRQAFLGSLSLVVALTIGVMVEEPEPFGAERLPVTVFCLVLVVFLVYTHRSNIQKFASRSRAE
jgi:acyl phosphate:glycerol-3-phosphate acyltransferase